MPTTPAPAPGYTGPTGSDAGQYDYMWVNGQWFKYKGAGQYALSPTPPPQGASINPIYTGSPPPPGWWSPQMNPPGASNPPAQTSPPAGSAVDPDVQETFKRSAYMKGLEQAGYNPKGAFGGYLQERFEPFLANFWAQDVLGQAQGREPMNDLQGAVAGNVPRNAGGLRGESRNRFRDIAGAAPLGQFQDALRNVTSANMNQEGGASARGNLQDLARSAAKGQYGWLSSILPTDASLNRSFEDELYKNQGQPWQPSGGDPSAAQPGVDFAAFLKRMLGLR